MESDLGAYEHGLEVVGVDSSGGRVTSIVIRTQTYWDHSRLTDEATRSRIIDRQHMPRWIDNDAATTRLDIRTFPQLTIDEEADF